MSLGPIDDRPPALAGAMTTLRRRALSELVGTCFLVMAVVGSGIAAARLSPDEGLQLFVNSVVTGAALTALILALQPVSAAFNPLVTVVEAVLGTLGAVETAFLIGAQVLGGAVGAVLANLMFDLDAVTLATTERGTGGVWLAEAVATAGLLLVVFGTLRTGRSEVVAYAVGGYIAAAYWFASSTSFANPAVTVARMLTDTFTGIAPGSVPLFLLMQVAGAAVASALIRVLFVTPRLEPAR